MTVDGQLEENPCMRLSSSKNQIKSSPGEDEARVMFGATELQGFWVADAGKGVSSGRIDLQFDGQ